MPTPFPYSPKIVYGGNTLTLSMSMGTWTPDREWVGGSTESAAQVPETYVLGKKGILAVTLKFMESEVANVMAWLDWVMDNGSAGFFDFYPDQTSATKYTVFLIKPKMGGRSGIKRSTEYRRSFELDIEIRTTNNTLFDIRL